VVYARAVWDRRGRWIRVRVDDFVAALFAFSDDGCDAAQDAFAFCVCALFGVAVEDFGGGEEAGFEDICFEKWGVSNVGFGMGER
jgi:hypothetical protein